MSHAQNRLTFPSAFQLATVHNRENTFGQICHSVLSVKTYLFHFRLILKQRAGFAVHEPVYPNGVRVILVQRLT